MNNENKTWNVKASDGKKEYTVQLNKARWVCSCNSFKYNCHNPDDLKAHDNTANHHKRRFCKHILEIKESLESKEQVYQDGKE